MPHGIKRNVAVIGAGVIGAVSAVELLRAGHKVTLIDSEEPGGEQAASYGNAGWLSTHSVLPPAGPGAWKSVPGYLTDPLGPLAVRIGYLPRALPWLIRYLLSGWTQARFESTARMLHALLKNAVPLHKRLAEEAGVAHLIKDGGLLNVFPSRAEFEADRLGWAIRRQLGIEWTELSESELRAREPHLDPRYRFAVLVHEAGACLDPGAYVAALAKLAVERGAQRATATATGFRIEGGRLSAVITDSGPFACDAAVIAAGIRSRPLAASLGDRLPLETERGYHVVVEGASVGPQTSMMVSDAKMVINWMEMGLRAAGQVEIAGLEAKPNWRRAEILLDHLRKLFPELPRDIPVDKVRTWLGHRPSMPDGRPCIGSARASRDIVYAFGHGHVGLVGSARTGRLVSQLVSREEPEISIEGFDPERYL